MAQEFLCVERCSNRMCFVLACRVWSVMALHCNLYVKIWTFDMRHISDAYSVIIEAPRPLNIPMLTFNTENVFSSRLKNSAFKFQNEACIWIYPFMFENFVSIEFPVRVSVGFCGAVVCTICLSPTLCDYSHGTDPRRNVLHKLYMSDLWWNVRNVVESFQFFWESVPNLINLM